MLLEIKPGERNEIPRQKLANAMGISGVARPDDSQPREVARPQKLPTSDECSQDDIAERRALVQKMAKSLGGDLVHLRVGASDTFHHRWTSSQMSNISGELSGAMDRDRPRRLT